MLPWKLRKRQFLPVNQNLLSVHFSLAKFQLVSSNLSLAMIWQMTYNHKLPKLCSTTLIGQNVGLGEGYEGCFTILCIVPQILPRKRACQTAQHIPVPYCKHLWFHHIHVLPSHEHKQYYTKCHTSVMRSLGETKSQDTRQEHVRLEKNENCNKD